MYEDLAKKYGGAFLTGAQANNYAANATNCFNRVINFWFSELTTLEWRYYYGSFDDNLYNTTRALSNMTNTLMVCFDSLENLSIFAASKM